jgi:hypothetical protein
VNGAATTWYIGTDGELKVDTANPTGLMTSYNSSEVRRVGSATEFMLKDGLGSIRFENRSGSSSWRDYGPYGMPSTDNGLTNTLRHGGPPLFHLQCQSHLGHGTGLVRVVDPLQRPWPGHTGGEG